MVGILTGVSRKSIGTREVSGISKQAFGNGEPGKIKQAVMFGGRLEHEAVKAKQAMG